MPARALGTSGTPAGWLSLSQGTSELLRGRCWCPCDLCHGSGSWALTLHIGGQMSVAFSQGTSIDEARRARSVKKTCRGWWGGGVGRAGPAENRPTHSPAHLGEGGLSWLFPLPGPPLSYTRALSPGKVSQPICCSAAWRAGLPLSSGLPSCPQAGQRSRVEGSSTSGSPQEVSAGFWGAANTPPASDLTLQLTPHPTLSIPPLRCR